MTDFDEIRQMLDLMDERGVEELEIEREGLRVRLRRPAGGTRVARQTTGETAVPAASPPGVPPADTDVEEDGLVVVKSPIVGTFYRASDPGSAPFVEIGSRVHKGDVLCIIEAMKLMNEIDADQDGEITKVFVENGQPVQYGEALFAIKPA